MMSSTTTADRSAHWANAHDATRVLALLLAVCALAACGDDAATTAGDGGNVGADAGAEPGNPDAPWKSGRELPAEMQEPGDAARGRDILLNGSMMSCGIPWKLWSDPVAGPSVQLGFGNTDPTPLDGRKGHNDELPYSMTAFTAEDGAEVVNRNCLTCHGGRFDGDIVIGLGNAAADFTTSLGGPAAAMIDIGLFSSFGLDDAETSNLDKMLRTARAVGPYTAMRTIGQNPAEQLTGALIAHHDRDTLAWSDEPLLPIEVRDADGKLIPDARLTSDPPPWWRAHKKHALFYNGMARGDHRGTMALATAVCVDNLDEARRVDDLFRDVQAFVNSVRPPKYKRDVDATLAARGRDVFTANCAGCHGTYADDPADDEHDTYPNLLIPLDVIGTDTAVADIGANSPQQVDWYNGSFYGKITRAVPDDPFPGYVPPPLDGIWATAPYLHNGSVPTVELLLNSKTRPKYWKRVDFDDTNFDEDALGWPWEEVPYSQADASDGEKAHIYDTTYWSQGNGGHTFGDKLNDSKRRAVIEYLKTL